MLKIIQCLNSKAITEADVLKFIQYLNSRAYVSDQLNIGLIVYVVHLLEIILFT